MKIKKIFSVLLISAVVMLPSASAFAENNTEATPAGTVAPMIVGIGDTRETAVSLLLNEYGGVVYDLFIQNATDQDWFKWTNTTGVYKRVGLNVGGFSGNGPTRAGLIINYNNHLLEFGPVYTPQAGTSNLQSFGNIFVPPGATVFIVVDSPNLTSAAAYHLNFAAYLD